MLKMKRSWSGRLAVDILFDIVGSLIAGVGLLCFSAPNGIAPGGVTGIAIIANHLSGISLSVLTLALNIPLLAMAWIFLGHYFTLNTFKTVLMFSVVLKFCERFPVYEGDAILAAIYGGILSGLGLAIIFIRGSTTGGTDIASRLLHLKFPHMPLGRLLFFVDGLVLVAAAIVYRNIENALYGLISIFATSMMIDRILYGLDTGKVMMVISEKYNEISSDIIDVMGRGCTFLNAHGSYTRTERPVLLCAVRKNEFHNLKRLVYSIDPDAFLLALDASEIVGEGFKPPETGK